MNYRTLIGSLEEPIKATPQNVPNAIRPRSFSNPDDVYDDVVGFDSPRDTLQPGTFRPMWKVGPVALQKTRITTAQSQGSPSVPVSPPSYKTGVTVGPSTTSTTLLIVPDMNTSVVTNGPVLVGFQITAQTVNANDPASFAVFRDGIQISPTFQGSSGAGTNFTVSQTMLDNPTPGTHAYALYWAKGTSTVTASSKNRSIYALSLKPS